MDVLHKILELKNSINLNDTDFEKNIGLNPKTVDNWKRGKSKSYLKILPKIADYFGVSADFLLDDSKNTDDYNPFIEFYSQLGNINKAMDELKMALSKYPDLADDKQELFNELVENINTVNNKTLELYPMYRKLTKMINDSENQEGGK